MFGSLGAPEIFLLLVLALVLVGPRRFPEIGRALGRAVVEFRRATAEFRAGIEKEVDLTSIREAQQAVEAARADLKNLARAPARFIEQDLAAETLPDAPDLPPAERPASDPRADSDATPASAEVVQTVRKPAEADPVLPFGESGEADDRNDPRSNEGEGTVH